MFKKIFGKNTNDTDDIPVISKINVGGSNHKKDESDPPETQLKSRGIGDEKTAFQAARPSGGRNVINFQTAAEGHAAGGAGSANAAKHNMKVMVVEPVTFDDAQHVADHIKNRKPVVVNFENTETDVAKRIIDFISGTTYALAGNLRKVGKDIFLCAPSNVEVDFPQMGERPSGDKPDMPTWKK